MPKYEELVGKPLLVVPSKASHSLFPVIVGENSPRRTMIQLEIKTRVGRKKTNKECTFWVSFLSIGDMHLTDAVLSDILIEDICPFCDQPLGPREPSWFEGLPSTTMQTLPKKMVALWGITTPSPRESNSQGREVSFEQQDIMIDTCGQHQYESLILPLSLQYRWPRKASFFGLLCRLFQPFVTDRIKLVYEHPWSGLVIAGRREEKLSRVQKKLLELLGGREPITEAGL